MWRWTDWNMPAWWWSSFWNVIFIPFHLIPPPCFCYPTQIKHTSWTGNTLNVNFSIHNNLNVMIQKQNQEKQTWRNGSFTSPQSILTVSHSFRSIVVQRCEWNHRIAGNIDATAYGVGQSHPTHHRGYHIGQHCVLYNRTSCRDVWGQMQWPS